ncbi:MAG: hypothetical protein SFU56_13340 [Capsulimonadales bacterium]|nr:hypothetical protein [Capsulimonadales bacterium]
MNIAIITGEASGDRVGGQLAQEIRKRHPDVELWGTGGKYLRAAGVEVTIDSARWGVVGAAAAVRIFPRILNALGFLRKELLKRRPDVVIPIDAGGFNIGFAGLQGVCPFVRKHLPDTKILYYFPPGSWRRTLKSSPLEHLADRVATPFPWSETELRRLGIEATFVGHPLLDLVHPQESSETFAARHGVDREKPVVGIFPGSRLQEIEAILPAQLAAASIIHQRVPAVQFLIGLAPTVDREAIEAAIRRERAERQAETERQKAAAAFDNKAEIPPVGTLPVMAEGRGAPLTPAELEEQRKKWLARAADIPETPSSDVPIAIVEDATYDVMGVSDVLLVTSGTVTLEGAILGKPMVITYRLASSNWLEYMLVRKGIPRFIGMPNLLADRNICPELVQDAATPENLAGEVIGLLLEPDRILRMREDLRNVVRLLGTPGGAGRTAEMVLELADAGNRRT